VLLWAAAAMIVAGVALFVAAPLAGGIFSTSSRTPKEIELERRQHDRALAVQGLRELEFDREMGKLADPDYHALRGGLETRALAAMEAIERLRADAAAKAAAARSAPRRVQSLRRPEPAPIIAPPPVIVPSSAPPRPAAAAGVARTLRFCPQCGTRIAHDAKFCGECGLALRPAGRATGWSD
jgi:cytochrome c-type biogenesis protein CcmI